MPQILTLYLVNDLGSDSIGGSQSDVPSLWPGTPTPYNFSLAPQAIRPVWVGVSADGVTNQVYPLTTSIAAIVGAGWPRVYQGTEIVGNHGDVHVFSEQYSHILSALAACCATSVVTAAFSLKLSNRTLDPDQAPPPCNTEASFKWLAVRAPNDPGNLVYNMSYTLTPLVGSPFVVSLINGDPLTNTVQVVKAWPADFQDVLLGDTEFDGGTITLTTQIYDLTFPTHLVSQDVRTFRLPETCTEESSSSSSGASDSASSSASSSASASASDPFPEVNPSELENLDAWYDVTDPDTVTVSGGTLQGLLDKGPNGLDLDSTEGAFPQYFSSGGPQNLAYAKITETRQLYRTLLVGTGGNLIFYIVYRYNNALTDSVFMAFVHNGSQGVAFHTDGAQNVIGFLGNPAGYISGIRNSATSNWEFVRKNYHNTELPYVQVNNEPYDPIGYYNIAGASPQDASLFDRYGIGFWYGVGQDMDADFCEMIVVKGTLTDAQDAGLRRYLVNKYQPTPNNSILFMGDSITYGVHSSDNNTKSFAALTCIDKGLGQINLGYPGGHVVTPGVYAAAPTLLGIDFIDKVYQLHQRGYDYGCVKNIVISYATNETDAMGNPVSLGLWKARYKATIQDLHALSGVAYAKIVLGTAPYQSGNAADMPALNTAIQEICTELGCVFCDFFTATQLAGGDTLLFDTIHPTDAGHQVMADTLIPLIA